MIRYGPTGTSVAVTGIGESPCVCDGRCEHECRLRSFLDGGRPLYEYRFVTPPQPQVKKGGKLRKGLFVLSHFKAFYFFSFNTQVDSFLQTRTWALQRQKNRSGNRLLPLQRSGSGLGSGDGGFVRKCGGTGVFLPRIASTTTTPNPTVTSDLRKKQGELLPFFFSLGTFDMFGVDTCCYCFGSAMSFVYFRS